MFKQDLCDLCGDCLVWNARGSRQLSVTAPFQQTAL